jgi:hypothetical protein
MHVFALSVLTVRQFNKEIFSTNGHYSSSCFYLKHNVSDTGFCLRLQVKPTPLGSIDRASPYLRISAQHKIGYTKYGEEKTPTRVKAKH